MKTANACARFISENKELIMSQWEDEVREEITVINKTTSIALRDHLPDLLEDIAQIINEKSNAGFNHRTDKYLQTVEKNKIHGREKAESEYTIDQVLLEYLILQRIITELLQDNGLLSLNLSNLLKYIFARTVINAAISFSASIQQMQDKVVGTLAHDIRNPLTTALTSIHLMAKKEGKDERLIELARKGVTRSIDLTEGLLDTISVQSGQGMMMNFSESDYSKIVKETCDEASEIYMAKISCDVPERPVYGIFDESGIKRILDNLISNAIKYGDKDSYIYVFLQETRDEVILSVKNHGHPIPEEKQDAIFSFLARSEHKDVQEKGKSWGIGLALVRLIVDAHNGCIDLKSSKKEGTTFRISLTRKLHHAGKVRVQFS